MDKYLWVVFIIIGIGIGGYIETKNDFIKKLGLWMNWNRIIFDMLLGGFFLYLFATNQIGNLSKAMGV